MAKSERLKIPTEYLLRIAARDKWTCPVCDEGFRSNDPWEVDHDVPLASGGTNHLKNLRICHRSCNRDKATL